MISIDIETMPNAEMISKLPPVEADSRLKDPDKIAADIAKKADEQVNKMALSPWYGMVASVSVYDGVDCQCRVFNWPCTEEHLISFVLDAINGHQYTTWNGMGFDLPFLYTRAMVLGINAHSPLSNHTKKYSRGPHIDLMQEFCGWGREKYMGLNDAARLLLGEEKNDFDVTKIREMVYSEVSPVELIMYNNQDAILTHRLYEKAKMYLF